MLKADELQHFTIRINSKHVALRPKRRLFIFRFKDAFMVLIGKAEAVEFYKQ